MRIHLNNPVCFLQLAEKLIAFAIGKRYVVIAETTPRFLDFSAELIELAFYLILIHRDPLVIKALFIARVAPDLPIEPSIYSHFMATL